MMQKNKNRLGYKKTKVGWIPEEWTFGRIGDFFDVTSGSTPSRLQHDDYFLNGDVEWVKTMDLNNSMLFKTSERITKKGLKESSCKMLPINTVLVAMYGGFNQIGRTGLLKMEAACNQALSAILPSKSYNAEFLLAWLNSQVLYWKKLSASSRKDPNITKNDVNDFPLITPPLPEQIAIAEVLDCWDKGIRTLEKKIEKKRLVKNGLMQKLLSGETRLRGFSGLWKNVRLGKLGEFSKGVGITKENLSVEGVPYIRYGEIYTVHGFVVKKFYSYISPALASQSVKIRRNDLLFAGSGETAEEIGKSVAYMDEAEAYTGGDVILLSVHPTLGRADYLSYYLNSIGRSELNKLGQGQSVVHIYTKNLAKVSLILPPLDEQRAIVKVLSAADAEIEALERKLALLKDQKRFLLNNLVTGAIRLPEFRREF